MIYNLKNELPKEVIENGVYESLTKPEKNESVVHYLDKIQNEITDCPFIHCPDYDLLVPISDELTVYSDEFVGSVSHVIHIICYYWWMDVNR